MSNLGAKSTLFRIKIGHFSLKDVVFLECRQGHFEGRQGQVVTLACFQNPKTAEMSL